MLVWAFGNRVNKLYAFLRENVLSRVHSDGGSSNRLNNLNNVLGKAWVYE